MIVVIGAGVCALAAAYELSRRGQRAIVLERGKPFAEQSVPPFAEQSAGLARIDFETYRGLASAPVASPVPVTAIGVPLVSRSALPRPVGPGRAGRPSQAVR